MFDAPWEGVRESWDAKSLADFKEQFLRTASRQRKSISKCTIYVGDDPIGWLSSYDVSHDRTSLKVGIDICVDSRIGKGLGTRSLALWIDYWFMDRKMHRVGLDTWSFNKRMMRVAEK